MKSKLIVISCFFISKILYSQNDESVKKHIYNNFSIPEKNWGIYIPFYENGFSIIKDVIDKKKEKRNISAYKKSGADAVYVTVFIEPKPIEAIKDNEGCKNYYLERIKKLPLPYDNLYEKKYKNMFVVQRDVFLYENDRSKISKNVNAFIFADGYCVDVHISKTLFRKGDSVFLNKIIDSIKTVSPYNQNIYDYFQFGNVFFYSKDFKNAINYYEKALESDKKEKKLTKPFLIAAIDNLGMAYGISGDYKAALLKFNMGLERFPDYPTFYYNRAATYAEMGEREKALSDLELAFKNKDKLLKGERLANPYNDPSFKSMLDDYRFIDLVKNKLKLIKD
ncbi:MAG: tetratricopeptide repeat protein [Elusimicrobiales bacterium]|nr:tetratricopeptide repeat protein [Elusimicrobiales bacterium]HOL63568.1 tetratricopeptide repeat protein [Elusimicrobiales bacterium]